MTRAAQPLPPLTLDDLKVASARFDLKERRPVIVMGKRGLETYREFARQQSPTFDYKEPKLLGVSIVVSDAVPEGRAFMVSTANGDLLDVCRVDVTHDEKATPQPIARRCAYSLTLRESLLVLVLGTIFGLVLAWMRGYI